MQKLLSFQYSFPFISMLLKTTTCLFAHYFEIRIFIYKKYLYVGLNLEIVVFKKKLSLNLITGTGFNTSMVFYKNLEIHISFLTAVIQIRKSDFFMQKSNVSFQVYFYLLLSISTTIDRLIKLILIKRLHCCYHFH